MSVNVEICFQRAKCLIEEEIYSAFNEYISENYIDLDFLQVKKSKDIKQKISDHANFFIREISINDNLHSQIHNKHEYYKTHIDYESFIICYNNITNNCVKNGSS